MLGKAADCPRLPVDTQAEAADKELIRIERTGVVSVAELTDAVSKWE